MLGGTDLALAFNEQTAEFPLVDCAGIHVDAIARLAIAWRVPDALTGWNHHRVGQEMSEDKFDRLGNQLIERHDRQQ
jgi:hypothetical protein